MEIDVPKDTSDKIDFASRVLDVNREEIINRALQVYLDNLSKFLELKNDFKEWDRLSDEALFVFEKGL
jgi:hypothetical protein